MFSSRKIHFVKVFEVTLNGLTDLGYGIQVAHVVLVREKVEDYSAPTTSVVTTFFPGY